MLSMTNSESPRIVSPAPLVLRAEPIKLENLDSRCLRNAVLQAFMPVMIDVMNLHAQRTGITLDDQQWIKLVQNAPTGGELLAIALGRTVLALNVFTDNAVGHNCFNNAIVASHYAADACSTTLLTRELVEGINSVTATNMAFYQLPVDRELVPSFAMEQYITTQWKEKSAQPDYLVVDVAGVSLRALDQHSVVKNVSFSGAHEQSLPAQIAITDKEGKHNNYELCSFISIERSGIPAVSSLWSRLSSLIQHSATQNVATLHILPMRHAVSTVRYGNSWFIADDGCIWKVANDVSAQVLVNQQPGYRAVMVYKKVDAVVDATIAPAAVVDLVLNKIDGPEGMIWLEQPYMLLLSALGFLLWGLIAAVMGFVAWRGIATWSPGALQSMFRVWSILMFSSIMVMCGGSIAYYTAYALRARKRLQKQLVFTAQEKHRSGLYS